MNDRFKHPVTVKEEWQPDFSTAEGLREIRELVERCIKRGLIGYAPKVAIAKAPYGKRKDYWSQFYK